MRNLLLPPFQDNYNVLHVASMYSREDVVKTLLNKKGVDPYTTGGVSVKFTLINKTWLHAFTIRNALLSWVLI